MTIIENVVMGFIIMGAFMVYVFGVPIVALLLIGLVSKQDHYLKPSVIIWLIINGVFIAAYLIGTFFLAL